MTYTWRLNSEIKPDSLPHLGKPRKSSFLASIAWGMAIFLTLLVLAEAAFHLDKVSHHFQLRSLGNYHAQFEIKWFKLEDYVKANGGVDVVILGNSMVNTGIDPTIVATEYRKVTGQRIRVFNFGVEGLTIAPLSDLAQIIEEKYHPATILLYTEMRDYVDQNQNNVETQFLSSAWIRQQMGFPSLEGTLIEYSSLLQHLLPLRNWSRSDFIDTYFMNLRRWNETNSLGYEADKNTGWDYMDEPDPNDPAQKQYFDLYSNFTIAADREQALQEIVGLQSKGTRVIVSEIPVFPTYYTYFGGESVHAEYEKDITRIVNQAGGIYVPAFPYTLIPYNGHVDNHHLNYVGAHIFSRALGDKLAALCEEKDICLKVSAGKKP